jgi:hypothetical protein
LVIILNGCCETSYIDNSVPSEYFEDFESDIIFDTPIPINGGSYIKYGSNDWICYIEKSYDQQNVTDSWNWKKITDSNSGKYGLRGTTTVKEMGGLWLFKKFKIIPNKNVSISVFGRTKKIHRGGSTGPGLYVFEDEIKFPKADHPELLGRDYFTWDYGSWSDWQKLDTVVKPDSEWITVALYIKDSWDSYAIYHEFDNLRISIE